MSEAPERRGDLTVLCALAALRLALSLATARGYGIFGDELYYLACADHPAWGYVDHPPLSIAVLWLWRAAFGDSLVALRVVPALAGAATVFATGWIARELGGGRAAQVLAGLAAFFAPFFLAVSHFYSMNALDVLFWALLLWLAVRILMRDEPRLWLWFGAIAGLGLENKYSVGFLGFGVVVGLAATRARKHLLLAVPVGGRRAGGAAVRAAPRLGGAQRRALARVHEERDRAQELPGVAAPVPGRPARCCCIRCSRRSGSSGSGRCSSPRASRPCARSASPTSRCSR